MIPQNKLPHIINDRTVQLAEKVIQVPCLPAFSAETTAFINALSGALLTEAACKSYPEITSLGFWLRASNIKRLQQQYFSLETASSNLFIKPLGSVLHIAPGNVDTMFVYSWVCSLVVGNNNIVRTPSRSTEAVQRLLTVISELLNRPEFENVAQRNIIATWPQESRVSAILSQKVQARMIWGGDETVARIRRLPTLPQCKDIAFSDKFSVSVLQMQGKTSEEIETLAELLWRDMNTFQQAACSSPKILVFCNSPEGLKQQLYTELASRAKIQVSEPSRSNNHLVTKQLLLAQHRDNQLIEADPLSIVKLHKLEENYIDWHPAQNFLYEYNVDELAELFDRIPAHCQTVSHFGFHPDELQTCVAQYQGPAVDRLVPVGQALNFSEYWDGFDVLRQLSRLIELRT